MKNTLKLFIIAIFTIISTSIYSQKNNDPEFKGKIIAMTSTEITIFDYATGEVINAHPWSRPGAMINFKTGDEITFIIIDFNDKHPLDRILVTEIRRGL